MTKLLAELNADLDTFARQPTNSSAFMIDTAEYVRFSALTGLNDASFVARFDRAESLQHTSGALKLSAEMVRYVSLACNMDPPQLPHYVLITGNTEQRYMRTLFLKDHRHMFRLIVENDLPDFAGSGVGVLNQFLNALPADVNLMRASNYIFKKTGNVERGRIDVIGHWSTNDEHAPQEMQARLTERFTKLIGEMVLNDVDGRPYRGALKLIEVATTRTIYPKVYVSFSIGEQQDKLDQLVNALIKDNYEPIFGIEQRQDEDMLLGRRRVGGNVTHAAFSRIDGCVALISLQVKRDELRTLDKHGRPKHLLPPWLVAEEVYAWSHPRKPHIMRLRDADVQGPMYDRNVWEAVFESEKPATFKEALDEVIVELNRFATSERFANLRADARAAQFADRPAPPDLV